MFIFKMSVCSKIAYGYKERAFISSHEHQVVKVSYWVQSMSVIAVYRQQFKWHLLLYYWTNFYQTSQECSLDDHLQKQLKEISVKKHGRQGGGGGGVASFHYVPMGKL